MSCDHDAKDFKILEPQSGWSYCRECGAEFYSDMA